MFRKWKYCVLWTFCFCFADFKFKLLKKQEISYSFLSRCQSQWSNDEKVESSVSKEVKDEVCVPLKKSNVEKEIDSQVSKYGSAEDDFSITKWKLELDWLTKALEPALQLYKRTLLSGMFRLVL